MSETSDIKSEMARLEARLAALEPKPIKPAKYEEGVRITSFAERGAFEMPSKEQARKLIDLVQKRYSALRLPGEPSARDREVEFDRFLASFLYLGFADRRTDGLLDTRGYASWFCDAARTWLRSYGGKYGEDVSPQTLIAAALAHGDIAVGSADDFRSGTGFGLSIIPVGSGGRKCANKWRGLLDGTLRVREPVA